MHFLVKPNHIAQTPPSAAIRNNTDWGGGQNNRQFKLCLSASVNAQDTSRAWSGEVFLNLLGCHYNILTVFETRKTKYIDLPFCPLSPRSYCSRLRYPGGGERAGVRLVLGGPSVVLLRCPLY